MKIHLIFIPLLLTGCASTINPIEYKIFKTWVPILLGILEERLVEIRATDPKKFALFTGCDQMQALTGCLPNNSVRRITLRMADFALSIWQPA